MALSLIAAVARNRIIGGEGGIPWDIPADRRRFRELTMGHPVIMGRKTYESIGHPLEGRRTIVVTSRPDYRAEGCDVSRGLADALALCCEADEIFVAGGGELYREALPLADGIYLTLVDIDVPGDTTFPELAAGEFVEARREIVSADPPAILILYRRTPGR